MRRRHKFSQEIPEISLDEYLKHPRIMCYLSGFDKWLRAFRWQEGDKYCSEIRRIKERMIPIPNTKAYRKWKKDARRWCKRRNPPTLERLDLSSNSLLESDNNSQALSNLLWHKRRRMGSIVKQKLKLVETSHTPDLYEIRTVLHNTFKGTLYQDVYTIDIVCGIAKKHQSQRKDCVCCINQAVFRIEQAFKGQIVSTEIISKIYQNAAKWISSGTEEEVPESMYE